MKVKCLNNLSAAQLKVCQFSFFLSYYFLFQLILVAEQRARLKKRNMCDTSSFLSFVYYSLHTSIKNNPLF